MINRITYIIANIKQVSIIFFPPKMKMANVQSFSIQVSIFISKNNAMKFIQIKLGNKVENVEYAV